MPSDSSGEAPVSFRARDGPLDPVNLRLLAELRGDPRLPMTAARPAGRHVGAGRDRARAPVGGGAASSAVTASTSTRPRSACHSRPMIRVRPNPGQLRRIAALAQATPEVVECHRITGEDCFILKVHLPAMDQLDRVLDCFLFYGTTTTSLVQSSPVPSGRRRCRSRPESRSEDVRSRSGESNPQPQSRSPLNSIAYYCRRP